VAAVLVSRSERQQLDNSIVDIDPLVSWTLQSQLALPIVDNAVDESQDTVYRIMSCPV
jgi:hypothetical protein